MSPQESSGGSEYAYGLTLAAFLLPLVCQFMPRSTALVESALWFVPALLSSLFSAIPSSSAFLVGCCGSVISLAQELYQQKLFYVPCPVPQAIAERSQALRSQVFTDTFRPEDESDRASEQSLRSINPNESHCLPRISDQDLEQVALSKEIYDKLDEEHKVLKSDYDQLRLEIEELSKKNCVSEYESKNQLMQIESLNKKLLQATADLSQKDKHVIAIESELSQLRIDFDRLQEELKSAHSGAQFKQLREQFEEKKRELIHQRRALFSAEEEIEMLQRRLADERDLLDMKAFQSARDICQNISIELEALQQERQLLEEIVARLSKEKEDATRTASHITR